MYTNKRFSALEGILSNSDKCGVFIEEHVFNDKGIEIQSFSYNSLDPSSKLYTENEVDENGKVTASFDESGEHKTGFEYESDGVTVKTERLPNGSKFSYGSASHRPFPLHPTHW